MVSVFFSLPLFNRGKVVYLIDTELPFFVFLYGGVFSQVRWLSFQGVCLLLSAGAYFFFVLFYSPGVFVFVFLTYI